MKVLAALAILFSLAVAACAQQPTNGDAVNGRLNVTWGVEF
jgi:hypothetical protein